MDSTTPRICIAVCTTGWNRQLATALNSLIAQRLDTTLHRAKLALLVIVNSSHDQWVVFQENFRNWLSASQQTLNDIHAIHEPAIGIPYARNRAIREARQANFTHLAFIDDDCVAYASWLSELYKHAEIFDVVAGATRIVPAGPISPWLPEGTFGLIGYPAHSFVDRTRNLLLTAYTRNVLFRLDLIVQPEPEEGWFPIKFADSGGEDVAFFESLADNGASIRFAPKARVRESYGGERLTLRWHFLRGLRNGQLFARRARLPKTVFRHSPGGIRVRPFTKQAISPSPKVRALVGQSLIWFAPRIGFVSHFLGFRRREYTSRGYRTGIPK